VVAVSGQNGTGKTHLLFDLLRIVRERGDRPPSVYVEAQGGGFIDLYKNNFLSQFPRADILQRIREHYARIVADSLRDTGFPADILERLRDARIDPQRFVGQFNLAESTFLEALHRSLADVTENEQYGTALMLLLHSDMSDSVWEWLRGEQPSPLLAERGITTPIATDADALEAMGVLTLLHRGGARRLVLAIDQLEKVLPSASRPEDATVTALYKLMALMAREGVLLVLSGQPPLLSALGAHAREHYLTEVIETGGLDPAQVRRYIEQCVQNAGRDPFTPEICDYIARLADGSIRRVVEICHECYRDSYETGEVTHTMALRAARGVVRPDQAEVRNAIAEELRNQGLSAHTDHPVDDDDGPRAPYWIPVGRKGCALFLTESLVLPDDAAGLIERADAVLGAAEGCRTALIVNDFVSDTVRDAVRGHFTEPVLCYRAETFPVEFARLLHGMIDELESAEGDLRVVRSGLNRLAAAQDAAQENIRRHLAMIGYGIGTMQTAWERQFAELAREVREVRGADRDEPASPLPDEVAGLFTEVLDALERLSGLQGALAEAFGEDATGPGPGLLLRLQRADVVQALGVAAVGRTVVTAFRDAVGEWAQGSAGPPGEDRLRRLNALCRTYSTVMRSLPIQQLGTLAQLPPDAATGWTPPPGPARTDLYDLLVDLEYKVRREFASGV
jgi:hypothetical protein